MNYSYLWSQEESLFDKKRMIWIILNLFDFFLWLIMVLFTWKAYRQGSPIIPKCLQQPQLSQMKGAENSTWVCCMGGKDHLYFQGRTLIGRWNQKWRQDANPGTLTWAEELSSSLPHMWQGCQYMKGHLLLFSGVYISGKLRPETELRCEPKLSDVDCRFPKQYLN